MFANPRHSAQLFLRRLAATTLHLSNVRTLPIVYGTVYTRSLSNSLTLHFTLIALVTRPSFVLSGNFNESTLKASLLASTTRMTSDVFASVVRSGIAALITCGLVEISCGNYDTKARARSGTYGGEDGAWEQSW